MHHANVKDASIAIGSKTNLQHLQTLNKYINANKSHSIIVPSHLWHHKIHLLYVDPLGIHTHNQSVSTNWNQDLQTKKIQTELGTNPALSPYHCHKLPLYHVSKLSMESWWKNPSSNHENQLRHQTIKEIKCTSWAPQNKPNNHDPQPKISTIITKSGIQTNEHQGCTYISNHVMSISMAPWSHPWTEHLTLNVSNLSA